MEQDDRSARTRLSWTGVGVVGIGSAAWGLLQLAQGQLSSFHLRTWPQVLIAASIGTLGVAVAQRGATKARRAAADERDGAIDAALVCWPPRVAASLSPYDLGVHPTGEAPTHAPAYVQREADDALTRALDGDALTIVYGPPRSGKSRTAYEAVRRACPGAKLLVPTDAAGLATLLAHAARLAALYGAPLVLWLDELERYLPGLDLDALDRLVADDPEVRVVATIGEDALGGLLDEGGRADGDAAVRPVARRLLARARAIRLPAPSAVERQAAHAGSLRARLGEGWSPAPLAPAPPPVRRRPLDLVLWGVGALAVALVVATCVVGKRDGWTDAPPLKDQLAALHDDAAACETLTTSPADSASITKRTVLVVVVQRELCLGSDEARLYRIDRSQRLRQFAALRPPADGGRWTFACVGPQTADPCAVTLEGGARVLAGAFQDPRVHQALPVSLHPLGERLNLASLSPQRPAADPRLVASVLRTDRRPVVLSFGAHTDDGAPAACAAREGCLRGHPAEAWAAFPSATGQQAVIVAGYLEEGTPDVPRVLRVAARQLLLADGVPAVGRPCWVYAGGQRLDMSVTVDPRVGPQRALATAWRRAVAPARSAIVC